MSGGGGGGTTISTAELPPELRPLFSGAGTQLLATQRALPLSQFAAWNPGSVAGIAPLQQEALNLLPSTAQAPGGLQALYGSAPGLNAAATGLYDVAGQTGPMQAALNTLSNSGRIAPMQLAGSPMSTEQFSNTLPNAPSGALFPGMPPVPQGAATGPVAMTTPGRPDQAQIPTMDNIRNMQAEARTVQPHFNNVFEMLRYYNNQWNSQA